MTDREDCGCIDTGDGWWITNHCATHGFFGPEGLLARLERGEANLVGLRALLGDPDQ